MAISSINTIADGAVRQQWMDAFQDILDEQLVAKGVCEIATGNTRVFHNPLQSTPTGFDGASATTYTTEAITISDDTLIVDRRAGAAEHIDNIEAAVSLVDYVQARASRQAYVTAKAIDTYVLALPNTTGVAQIDDGDLTVPTNGGAGNRAILSATNVSEFMGALKRRLAKVNAQMEKGVFVVVPPEVAEDIESFAISAGFNVADASLRNGFAGRFRGIDVFVSNNLTTVGANVNGVGGVYGAIFCAMPSLGDEFDVKPVEGKHGREVVTSQWYDATIWTNNQAQVFDLQMTV